MKNLLLFFTILSIFSCKTHKNPIENFKKHELKFQMVEEGDHSHIKEPMNIVIQNINELHRFREKFNLPKKEFPLNFEKEILAGIFLGQQTTGGYTIEIVKVTELADSVWVNYRVKKAKLATMVLSEPYELFKIEKTNKPIRFQFIK